MELLGTTTILLLICISCLLLFATQRSTSHKGKEPPGPMTFPIVGNILHLNPRNVPESLKKLSEKYGPVFTIYLGPKKVVVLYGYDVVKEALIDQADDFSGRGTLPLITKLFRGTGIVTSNGETWKQLRRFALTTLRDFGMGKKSIEERIQEEAHFLVERIKNTHRQPFNPGRFLLHAVSNIICSIVFGDRFDYEDKKFLTLIDLIEENNNLQLSVQAQLYNFFPTIMDYIPGPHKQLIENVEKVDQFTTDIVMEHQKTLDPTCPRDFVDAFLIKMEQEKGNSHSEFNTETLTRTTLDLFLAGTGTTSVTLRHGFLILHKYPEIVEKIQQEIDSVIGRDRSPRMADRSRMPYTDAVIHEIQRYIDFIPLNVPHAVIKDTKFRDYFIPKDTMIFPMLSSVLHDSKEFPNPEKFDPGHFLNANGTFKKSDYFMPFSAGKRICAGEGLARMEIFIFVTSILQNFTLKPVVDLKDIDTTPLISSLASMPRHYEISFVPR
ncbi:PREDICTED: cytochrome P450 2H1-like isoform X1 [Acanthisitta chloris]|uniref:unspecific monooxygenase n=1 Tax=Acanthisitta chloris TaxID=57068 RepID=A0A091NE97_9PASS|nr:PREDICTED: cytochrome P450 2H1-like isoform X1 [Acanthisitta chloris]KFP87407.1 Cytochrome P450 2H1 [Acanthisitta chloris]